jgi:hypothetical protein
LAIIAYRQPVGKNEVEKIRGIDSSHMIRILLDKRLIKMVGRSEEWGRPILYGTTNEFLEVFNLKDISDLPPEHDLQNLAGEQEVGVVENIRQAVQSLERHDYSGEALEELDQISQEIKAIHADTPFTRTLRLEAAKKFNKTPVAEGAEPPPPPRTAYEILEEHVAAAQAKEAAQNQNADAASAHSSPAAADLPPTPDQEMFPAGDKQALAEALDQVFGKMAQKAQEEDAENSSDNFNEELNYQHLDQKAAALGKITTEMAEKAAKLELNLDFLKDTELPEELLQNLTAEENNPENLETSPEKNS